MIKTMCRTRYDHGMICHAHYDHGTKVKLFLLIGRLLHLSPHFKFLQ